MSFLYSDPRGVRIFSDYSKVPEGLAVQIRDEFMPKPVLSPDKVSGIEQMMRDAVAFRMLSGLLSGEQLSELIRFRHHK